MEKIQASPALVHETIQVIQGKIQMQLHELARPHRKWVLIRSTEGELLECHPVAEEVQ